VLRILELPCSAFTTQRSARASAVIAAVKRYQALGVQYPVLDVVLEPIDNALATMDRLARGVRPALG
jgi:hypothetical protein